MPNEIAFGRTRHPIGAPAFIADRSSVDRDTGHQIDWDALGPDYSTEPQRITLNGNAAAGAVSITVDPLPVDLEVGDALEFGTLEQVTVTVGVAGAAANDTSVPVAALSGPIPDNYLLDFGGKKFARVNGNVAAGATAIVVDAIPTALVSGDAAIFEGGTKVAIVDAAAVKGATTVTVEDLPLSLTDNDVAIVPGEIGSTGLVDSGRTVKAGTVMDLLSNGKMVPSALGTGGVTAFAILATNANEDAREDAATGYGVILGGVLYENLLPEASGSPAVINSTWKTELLARGGAWIFVQYGDNT